MIGVVRCVKGDATGWADGWGWSMNPLGAFVAEVVGCLGLAMTAERRIEQIERSVPENGYARPNEPQFLSV
jgi:hypothetical protein